MLTNQSGNPQLWNVKVILSITILLSIHLITGLSLKIDRSLRRNSDQLLLTRSELRPLCSRHRVIAKREPSGMGCPFPEPWRAGHHLGEVSLTEDHHVIQTLTSNRTDHPLCECILPRTPGRADDLLAWPTTGFDAEARYHRSHLRSLPVDPALVSRRRQLGERDWVFCSREGTPVNPGNALKRYVRPAATELGIHLGGWHDFRHTLTTTMRRGGVHPKAISGILGHAGVALAMNVYDHADVKDFQQPLAVVAGELLRNAIGGSGGISVCRRIGSVGL
jgi:Phage integrase family